MTVIEIREWFGSKSEATQVGSRYLATVRKARNTEEMFYPTRVGEVSYDGDASVTKLSRKIALIRMQVSPIQSIQDSFNSSYEICCSQIRYKVKTGSKHQVAKYSCQPPTPMVRQQQTDLRRLRGGSSLQKPFFLILELHQLRRGIAGKPA